MPLAERRGMTGVDIESNLEERSLRDEWSSWYKGADCCTVRGGPVTTRTLIDRPPARHGSRGVFRTDICS